MQYYNLDENNNPIPCTLEEGDTLYATDTGKDRRRVAMDKVGNYEISTAFLGLDHGLGCTKRPLLFETMVFGDALEYEYQTRCSTWDEAIQMHKKAIDWVKNGCKDDDMD